MKNADDASAGEALPVIRPDSEIVREMRTIRRFIDQARSARSLDPLFGYLYAAIERNTPAPIRDEAACGPRCAWCCHTRVSATAPEILFLARQLSMGANASIAAAIPERAAQRRKGWDRPLVESLAPCAVLVDGLCAAHPSRPIACRTTISFDADQCRRAHDNPEDAVIPSAIGAVALRAVYDLALQGAMLGSVAKIGGSQR